MPSSGRENLLIIDQESVDFCARLHRRDVLHIEAFSQREALVRLYRIRKLQSSLCFFYKFYHDVGMDIPFDIPASITKNANSYCEPGVFHIFLV